MIRIAILDLYEGHLNEGMRCLRQVVRQWSAASGTHIQVDEFEVRQKVELPDLSYDIYLSSGGPGSPLASEGSEWDNAYINWLQSVEEWNKDGNRSQKKFVFFICHSFQIVCRHYGVAVVTKRKSSAFGVFPTHRTTAGENEITFKGLNDPFYVVDSRKWQVVQPNHEKLKRKGAKILCIEKERPHVPYERAIMGIRFNPYMIGTQFHPEADAQGMSLHLQKEEKKRNIIKEFGAEKWHSMVEQLNDPDKIMWTYSHIIPNFLSNAAGVKNDLNDELGEDSGS
ncbi:GMP synthase [Chitinophagaceae bacterium LB-8]|uniref:GMP synthase n=1 Tax=Paraflavisolibacter caeni TaxID=2982496 RepID=A0A9X2XX56_9BACT|nr:GMP synthase [Paraflavisolibacter caeni]MCU7550366.1 GMP synthase [Paraflavisolibacter caeni]